MKILIFGAGKMVEAILQGLSRNVDLSRISIFTPEGLSAKKLSEKFSLQWVKDLEEVRSESFDFVMIGCKPQQLKNLAESFPNSFKKTPIISLLAAVPEEAQLNILGANQLIRIMPNLAVKYGYGVSLISSQTALSSLKSVLDYFSCLGHFEVVEERELEELTLLTGSGPALYYEFTKNLAESFESLNSEKRQNLARLVLLGSAITSHQSGGESLTDLTNAVTSKGGVTIEVLSKWRSLSFFDFIKSGILAGKTRSTEIVRDLRL